MKARPDAQAAADPSEPAIGIIWSARSERDLAGIRVYIGRFAPLAAQRFALRLVGTVESLAAHPKRGRVVRGEVRELVVVAPDIVRYRITAQAVEVIRIRHGAQRPD
ncbi:MAG TPA: type II toxin-antitoxin system RelE/ParE family toxin [Phenylobacterium sp.]|jgi:plasmid stabilization system protein ParE|nr:type II toxin-antitoxin system RelE/ParE family toxin [Phenylobacterium sp.]